MDKMYAIYHAFIARLFSFQNLNKKKAIKFAAFATMAAAAFLIHQKLSKNIQRKYDHQNKPPQSDPPQITNSQNNPPLTNPPQAIDPQNKAPQTITPQKNDPQKQLPQVINPQIITSQPIQTQINYPQIQSAFYPQNTLPQPVSSQNNIGKATTPETSDCLKSDPSSPLVVYPNIIPKAPPIHSTNPQDELMVDKCDAINILLEIPASSLPKADSQYHTLQFTSPKAIELIKYLLDNSSRQRNVNENFKQYIIETLEKNDFQNYYSLKILNVKQKLSKYCTKMIHVRGDGNCFYTSFGYQLLRLVIYQYSNEEFGTFLNQNFTMPFKIQLQDQILGNQEQEQILLKHYKERIIHLRNLEKNYQQYDNYSSQLMRHFRAHEIQDELDGYFQPLTVLFLRNLCMYIVENCEEGKNVFDKENLLKWEEECNSNEQVISLLAQHFQIHIQLLLFLNGDFKVQEYSEEYKNKNRTIILLIKPGHYNIGLQN